MEVARTKYKEIAALQGAKDLYTYEKLFDKLCLKSGRSVLEQSISEASKDRTKERQLTCFGTVEILKAHPFSQGGNGFQVSLLMQELFLHAGVGEVYGKCKQVLHTFLCVAVCGLQVYWVRDCYGEMPEEQSCQQNSTRSKPLLYCLTCSFSLNKNS